MRKYDFLSSFNAHQIRMEWKRCIVQSGEGVCCEHRCGCSSVAKGRKDHFRGLIDVRRPLHTVLVCLMTAEGCVQLCDSLCVCLIQSVNPTAHRTCWHEWLQSQQRISESISESDQKNIVTMCMGGSEAFNHWINTSTKGETGNRNQARNLL